MLKKIIEKIFKRKELADLKEDVAKKRGKIKFLLCGETMHLDQHERRMILRAIELPPFREMIEAPKTKHYVRVVFKGLREKLKQSIKKEDDDTK